MLEPKEEHMEATKPVLGYLKGSPRRRIVMKSKCDLQLYAYCDLDWEGMSYH